ncbi:response regulator [Asticcacaulis sp. DXS10W]|uniref:Response regulator n=1 Tax=Asticcacaulis currens TaxID=2984210 RepID=A0ABT5IH16_9CAUL|nr:response regulator [Asticcacaulis currens]MDC7695424.1 response regulator [Asticcacaulis currens]
MSYFVTFEAARLLVVDDDPILREFALTHLATPEVSVEVAEDGADAWTKMGRATYDIVLLDLDMPRMDGFELLSLMRADPTHRHVPVVVATGREDMLAVDKAFANGATSFVIKPLNWRLVSHQLSYVLKNAREEAALRKTLRTLQDGNRLRTETVRLALLKLEESAKDLVDMLARPEAVELEEAQAATVRVARLCEALTQVAKAG